MSTPDLTTMKPPRRPFSTVEKTIVGLHFAAAAMVGIIGFIDANDPEFGGLQRIVILMFVALWVGGIVGMRALAGLVNGRVTRAAILLAGPFIGMVIVVASTLIS